MRTVTAGQRFDVKTFGAVLLVGSVLGTALFAGDAKLQHVTTPPRDWTKAPAIVQVETTEDIYALGDIHGDYDRLVRLLVAAKLIGEVPKSPGDVTWKGGKSTLVCTGDLIDKDKYALPVIALIQALRTAAQGAGGQVIVTMGNHEAEFLANPLGDGKDQDFLLELKDAGITVDEVLAGTDKLHVGQFFLTMPIAARVNDWFFVHAGNTKGHSLAKLDAAIRAGVDAEGYGASILSSRDSMLEARVKPDPWWGDQATLAQYVGKLGGVNHLVFGHQPGEVTMDGKKIRHKGKLTQLYDGLVFMIDVGMSAKINDSQGSLLRVHGGGKEATVIHHDGKTERIWTKP